MNRPGFQQEFQRLLSDLDLGDPPKRNAWFIEVFGHTRNATRWLNEGILPIRTDWDVIRRWIDENRSSFPDIRRRLVVLADLLEAERKVRLAKRKASIVAPRLPQRKFHPTATSGKGGTGEPASLSYERFLADTRIAAHLTTTGGKRSLYLDEVYVHRTQAERIVLEEAGRYHLRPKGYWLSIEGDAGHGKTSLLWFLARELHREYNRVLPVQALHLAADALGGLVDLLPNDGNPFFVLLDTLDLLVGIDDARLAGWLNDIRARGGFLITTCRRPERQVLEGYARSSYLLGLGRYESEEAHAAIKRYVEQAYTGWPRVRKEAQIEFVWELLDSRRRIQDLTFEPLLLRMIFEAYVPNEIPPDINTQQVYTRFWEQRVLGDRNPISPEQAHARSLLSRLIASHLYFEAEGHAEQLSIDTVARLGQSNGFANPLSVMRGLVSSGVLRWWQMRESVGFFHQTFLEYAAAKALLELADADERGRRVDLLLADLDQANLFRIPVLKQLMIQSSASDRRLFDDLCDKVVATNTPVAARLALEVLGKAVDVARLHQLIIDWGQQAKEIFSDVAPEVLRYYPVARLELAFAILSEHLTEKAAGKVCSVCTDFFSAMAPDQTLAFLRERWETDAAAFRGHETDLKVSLIALFRAGASSALAFLAEILPSMSTGIQAGVLKDLSKLWTTQNGAHAAQFLGKLFETLVRASLDEARAAYVRAFASLHDIAPSETKALIRTLREHAASKPDAQLLLSRIKGVAGVDLKTIREAVTDLLGSDHSRRLCARGLLREAAARQSVVLDELLALPPHREYSDGAKNALYFVAANSHDAARMLSVLSRWPPTETGAGNAFRVIVKNAASSDAARTLGWLKQHMRTAHSPAEHRQVLVGFQMLAEAAITSLSVDDISELFHWGFADRTASDEMRLVIAGFAGRFAEIDITFAKSAFRRIFSMNQQKFISAAVTSLQSVSSLEFILFVLDLTLDFAAKRRKYAQFGHFLAIMAERDQELRVALVRQLGEPKESALIKNIDDPVTASSFLKLLKSVAAAESESVLALAAICPILDDGNAAALAVVLENATYGVKDTHRARELLGRLLDLASNPSDRLGNSLRRGLRHFDKILPRREAVEAVRNRLLDASGWDERALEQLIQAAKRMDGWTPQDSEVLLRCNLPSKAKAALLASPN